MSRLKKAKVAGIYRIVCVPSGDQYVGSGANIASRRSAHFSSMADCDRPVTSLQKLTARYGITAFRWDVLETFPTDSPDLEELLRKAEFEWQVKIGREIGGHKLLSSPTRTRQIRGKVTRTIQQVINQFRDYCVENGLIPKDELARVLDERMGKPA